MKKYKKGEVITSLDELWKQPLVYWKTRVVSRGWFQNWQIGYLAYAIEYKRIFKIERIEDIENDEL